MLTKPARFRSIFDRPGYSGREYYCTARGFSPYLSKGPRQTDYGNPRTPTADSSDAGGDRRRKPDDPAAAHPGSVDRGNDRGGWAFARGSVWDDCRDPQNCAGNVSREGTRVRYSLPAAISACDARDLPFAVAS